MGKNKLEVCHLKFMANVNHRAIKNKDVRLIKYWHGEICTDICPQLHIHSWDCMNWSFCFLLQDKS